MRDVDAEVDQSDDEDFDEAELEKLFSERDVLDLMEELDDDGMAPNKCFLLYFLVAVDTILYKS